MKIARIRWAPFRIPFVAPYETAHGPATHRSGVIVVLEAASGVRGYGEGSLDPSAPAEESQFLIPPLAGLSNALIDADVDDFDDILEAWADRDELARTAHCAVETALADAGAREAGLPLAELLSADSKAGFRDTVEVNATIAARSVAEASAAALVATAQGYGCIKLKVGMAPTPQAEAERVRTVREVIGPGTKLRLDANGAWDEATAIATIRELEPHGIELLEQPVPPGDLESLGRVRAATATTIAADESVSNFDSGAAAILHADAIVLKPMRIGSLATSRYLARYALASGLGLIVTTTIDTGIGTAAALHLAATLPDEGRAHGLATTSLLQDDLLVHSLAVERGRMSLPEAPGLGVDLDEARAAKYLGAWQEVSA